MTIATLVVLNFFLLSGALALISWLAGDFKPRESRSPSRLPRK